MLQLLKNMLIYAGLLLGVTNLSAQKGPDTLTAVKVINPCTALDLDRFTGGITDSSFALFCRQVFTTQFTPTGNKQETVLQLLNSIKNETDLELCFLPFLKLADPAAEKKADALCGFHPYVKPPYYEGYCQLLKAEFVVLFYIEFVLIRKEKLGKSDLLVELDLYKNNQPVTDYANIIVHYRNWYEKNKEGKAKGHPLKGTGYSWRFRTGVFPYNR